MRAAVVTAFSAPLEIVERELLSGEMPARLVFELSPYTDAPPAPAMTVQRA
jgi:hypothetical protein